MAYGKIKADAIIYDNSGSDVEKTVVSLTTPEGTAVKSTGESGTTKFLRVDGDGTCSWQVPPDTNTQLTLVDEDNMSSNSATSVPSQQSTKAYVDTTVAAHILDEDNMATDSATKPPSQQSAKVYFAPKAAPAFTGTATGVNLTLSGNLTVNGTTTTVATTNTTVTDNLLELNSGAGSNANDSGILIERGSTGDNAIIAWDESADKFVVGTTTATNDATGNITIATGTLVANLEGNVTATTVTDGKGNVRSIPSNAQGGAYVGVAADAGKTIYISTGGVTINNSVFSAGDAVTIINNSGSDQTITQGSGVTLHNAADAATGNRTLAGRGMATIWFASASVAYISGAGLS